MQSQHLRKSLNGEGTLTMLLGGKNVGKSQVMKILAREYDQAMSGIMVASTSQHVLLCPT
jgi:ribosome biogenesis GTPase A